MPMCPRFPPFLGIQNYWLCSEQSRWGFFKGKKGEHGMSVFLAPPELCRREVEAQPNLLGWVTATMSSFSLIIA